MKCELVLLVCLLAGIIVYVRVFASERESVRERKRESVRDGDRESVREGEIA